MNKPSRQLNYLFCLSAISVTEQWTKYQGLLCALSVSVPNAQCPMKFTTFFQVAAHTRLQCKAKPIIACFLLSMQITQPIGSFMMLLLDHRNQHSSMFDK